MERAGAYMGGLDKIIRAGRVAIVITAQEEDDILRYSEEWGRYTIQGCPSLHNARIHGVRIVVAETEAIR